MTKGRPLACYWLENFEEDGSLILKFKLFDVLRNTHPLLSSMSGLSGLAYNGVALWPFVM